MNQIKIDGAVYHVVLGGLPEDGAEDGTFEPASQVILTRAMLRPYYSKVVLLHELIHACYEHAGAPEQPLTEEQVACLVSRRLLPILRDNPELVKWLTE